MGCKSAPDAFWSFGATNASGGQSVIADDDLIALMCDIDSGRVVLNIAPGETDKPEVQCIIAAIEAAQVVAFGEFLNYKVCVHAISGFLPPSHARIDASTRREPLVGRRELSRTSSRL
jgi:hypothetical protein